MNNSIKILLTINLEGGTLIRQSKPTFINWSQTERNINPEKKWKEGEGYNIVKKGISKHFPLADKEAIQRIKLTADAYNAMISDDCPQSIKKGDWMKMSTKDRLDIHMMMYATDLGGSTFSYNILEDE